MTSTMSSTAALPVSRLRPAFPRSVSGPSADAVWVPGPPVRSTTAVPAVVRVRPGCLGAVVARPAGVREWPAPPGRAAGLRRGGVMRRSLTHALPVEARERGATRVAGGVVELFLDTQELVVLGDAFASGRSPGLDLAAVGGHGEVGDGRVLRLAGPVAHHAAEAGPVGQGDRVESLGQRADLI